ncbi:MAG TPA: DNA-processing protein DprA [Geobacteraceae bacterium]
MDHYFWFALRAVPLVGNVAFRRLLERFETPERVVKASAKELATVKGIGAAVIASLASHDCRSFAERECRAIEKCGVRIVDFRSDEYPRPLLEIPDHPPFLYVKGSLRDLEPALAVVGARRASTYGLLATERLARDLVAQGVTVVSGMARGVDAAAHRSALAAGGRTVGVLGCGIDVVYPAENRDLFKEMAETGALVSEFPMGTTPLAENFPRRNRIISGMSRGVLVVEAAENSGSLITAQYALDQGREVFAVPGNINFKTSRGTNRLIKDGAKLVEGVEDIISELPPRETGTVASATPEFNLAPREVAIYEMLTDAPLHIDDIVVKSSLGVGDIAALLLGLELKGAIIQLPGKNFTIA